MWEKIDGKDVWVTREEKLAKKTKEELIEIVLDLEDILKGYDN